MFVLFAAALALLREPAYDVAREGGEWVVRKQQIVVSRHQDRGAAEARGRALPRLRLSGLFVRFDPATNGRRVVADWTNEPDALDVSADVRRMLGRSPDAPVYMARLYGATGHTAEEMGDPSQFVIYLDPYRATGRLHAAATIRHELAHVERYRARGFHANRAAAVLSKDDFVLLGLADELAAYQAEAGLVRSVLGNRIPDAMRAPELRWPPALIAILDARLDEARRQVALDLARVAARYWEARHNDALDPRLRQTIRGWRESSREWSEIAVQRREWTEAVNLPAP